MTTELLRPNQYDLFAKTVNVKDLIAERIENRIGGNFVGPWSDTISYNEGDIVIYTGCLYTSIANDNLNNIPSQTSAFWNSASLLKNTRLYNVNNDIGDDTKAVVPCGGPYPFRTLDAAYDQAVLDNPTGSFIIFIERTPVKYSFTRNIEVNDVRFISVRSAELGPTWINIPQSVTITGANIFFSNLQIRTFKTAPDNTPMFIIGGTGVRRIYFYNCQIGYWYNGVTNPNIPAMTIIPSNNGRVFFTGCGFNDNNYNISITDELGNPTLNGGIIITNSTSACVIDELPIKDSLTLPANFLVRVTNSEIIHRNNIFANIRYSNVGMLGDLNSTLNDPGRITMADVNFYDQFPNIYHNFNKTGNARFNLVNVNKLKNNTVAASLNTTSFDITAGPQYDYKAWNTYNNNDLVVYNGALYKCVVNDTIGITPDYGNPNWNISNINLLTLVGTGADLNLLENTDSQLLPLGAIISDIHSMISIDANLITVLKPGLYEVELGLTSSTTQNAGQNTIFNVYVDKNIATPLYPGSDGSTELVRGLVWNSTIYPTTNKITKIAVSITVPNQEFGIYLRNAGSAAFNVNIRNMLIRRIN